MRRLRGTVLFLVLLFCCFVPLSASAADLTLKPPAEVTLKAGETQRLMFPAFEGSTKLDDYSYSFTVEKAVGTKYVKAYGKWDEDAGNYYLCLVGLKAGTSEIGYTVKYRKEYDDPWLYMSGKLKVIVKKNTSLCLSGFTRGYDKKKKTYTLKVTNHTAKTVYVLPTGAKAAYGTPGGDRRLTLKGGKKKIKPGQTKKLVFKVQGQLKSFDFDAYEVQFSVKLKKKTYKVSLLQGEYDDTMYVKKGKKWKKMTTRDYY